MHALLVIGCVFSLFQVRGLAADCLDGFIRHHDSCYHFSHDKETWLDALDICQKLFDATLVEIETDNENQFIRNEVKHIGGNYWTGGNDLQVEGEWVWYTTGEKLDLNTWSPGNPSNSAGNENCMEIHTDVSGTLWNDNQCHVFQNYICEKHVEQVGVIG